MAKKNFAEAATTGRTYNDVMSTALADEEPTITAAAPEAQEAPKPGRKGLPMPRRACAHMNVALTPEQHNYIKTMAALHGISCAEFFDKLIADYMSTHNEVYEQAKKLRESL